MKYSLPKGVFDILPVEPKEANKWKEVARWQHVENVMRTLSHDYGYQEIRTPIFEKTELFVRGVGETSDIVSKEMYTFKDKGDRLISLRPEGTASVMRAFAQNGLQQLGSVHKLFYIGPFFRYDRPQAGRFRQFHQFGIEAIGGGSPYHDLEVIDMLFELYRRLGMKHLKVMINSLGSLKTRAAYREKLLAYLKPHFASLSEESRARFEKNPLRILDTKDPKEQALLEKAPTILDDLDPESKTHFETLTGLLKKQGIPFEITPHLVRGLDYYNRTVFEITSDVLGAQNTIGAGGRFDGLLEDVGGPDLPCVGFSTGIERILTTMEGQGCPFPAPSPSKVIFIPLGDRALEAAIPLLYELRHNSISAELISTKKLQKGLQQASSRGAPLVVVIGDEELEKGVAQLKDMERRTQEVIPLNKLTERIYAHA